MPPDVHLIVTKILSGQHILLNFACYMQFTANAFLLGIGLVLAVALPMGENVQVRLLESLSFREGVVQVVDQLVRLSLVPDFLQEDIVLVIGEPDASVLP